MRLLVVTEIPAPFRIPGFNALADQPDVELDVVVLSEHDPRRRYAVDPSAYRFGYHVLRSIDLTARGRWLALSFGLRRVFRRTRPDLVIVGGWNQPAFWQALVAARRRRIPAVLWVESTARDARASGGPAAAIRNAAVRAASGFVVPGRASGEYLQSLGVDRAAIAIAPNAIEHGVVRPPAKRSGDDGFTVLYVGRLEREKGPDVLVQAMREAPGTLVVVGDGSLRAELEHDAPPGRVRFVGHAARDELGRWYGEADAFVLPSRSDTWGMVLNEAAGAGLPLVASEVAGAAYDLVDEGVNGYRVPPEDPHAIAEALTRIEAAPGWRATAAARSRELAAGYTPEAWAEGVASLARTLGQRNG
ncbi:MAG TPA: glycosyltransferase family 4 protein [Gaiellaceae bacterium]|jgi:glycosyltransferase involved in cell wall biosynthesis|nr:glycosyltransferase family 4 protein [Gaiellaceae bacterium]